MHLFQTLTGAYVQNSPLAMKYMQQFILYFFQLFEESS